MIAATATHIKWDTEDNGKKYSTKSLNLPDSVIITDLAKKLGWSAQEEKNAMESETLDTLSDMYADDIIDHLSDHYGWCIESADIEIITGANVTERKKAIKCCI